MDLQEVRKQVNDLKKQLKETENLLEKKEKDQKQLLVKHLREMLKDLPDNLPVIISDSMDVWIEKNSILNAKVLSTEYSPATDEYFAPFKEFHDDYGCDYDDLETVDALHIMLEDE